MPYRPPITEEEKVTETRKTAAKRRGRRPALRKPIAEKETSVEESIVEKKPERIVLVSPFSNFIVSDEDGKTYKFYAGRLVVQPDEFARLEKSPGFGVRFFRGR